LEYDKEWWHYEFENESHPDTYFDFDIIWFKTEKP
jgi:D-alanyl-D-alanine dipeptidase